MNIDKHIKDLLFQQDKVAVKGLGTFVTYTTNALINDEEKLIEPPRKAVRFSEVLEVDDDIFTTFVSVTENISKELTERELGKYVDGIKEDVLSNKGYTILGVGTFLKEKDGAGMRFIPDPRANFNQSTFGLPSVGLPNKSNPSTSVSNAIKTDTPKEEDWNKTEKIPDTYRSKTIKEEPVVKKEEPVYKKEEPVYKKEVTETKVDAENEQGGDWNKLLGIKKDEDTGREYVQNTEEEEKTVSSVLADNVQREEIPEFDRPEVEETGTGRNRLLGCLLPLMALMLVGFLVFQLKNNTSFQDMGFLGKNKTEETPTTNGAKTYDGVDDNNTTTNTNSRYDDNNTSNETPNRYDDNDNTATSKSYESVEEEGSNLQNRYEDIEDEAKSATQKGSSDPYSENTTTASTNTANNTKTDTKANNNSTTTKTKPSNSGRANASSETTVYNASQTPKGYYANIGVFRSRDNALKLARNVKNQGYDAYVTNYKDGLYRIGIFLANDKSQAQKKIQDVKRYVKSDAWMFSN